jgi:hypothetical protein
LVEADFLIEYPGGIIASRNGVFVYIGPMDGLAQEVRRVRGAMRIDATGCTVLPARLPLAVGAPLDAVIVEGNDAAAVRMEIANGKIVRWEQPLDRGR